MVAHRTPREGVRQNLEEFLGKEDSEAMAAWWVLGAGWLSWGIGNPNGGVLGKEDA